jgi:hypothetical protein
VCKPASPRAISAVVCRDVRYYFSRMNTRPIFFLVLAILSSVFYRARANSVLPEDYPEIRFSMNPIYDSVGFQFGHILNARRMRPLLSTFEGELMLGFGTGGTGSTDVADRRCVEQVMGEVRRVAFPQDREAALREGLDNCYLFTNPWPFSFLDPKVFDVYTGVQNRPVVIYYSNFFWRPEHLLMKTRNHLQGIYPIQEDLEIQPSFHIPNWAALNPEAGQIQGRVVRASLVYPFRKSYEVIIQEGVNANNFRAMSVSDGDLFRYITRAMLSGRQMRISYMRLYGPHGALKTFLLNYRSNYRIIGVDLQ